MPVIDRSLGEPGAPKPGRTKPSWQLPWSVLLWLVGWFALLYVQFLYWYGSGGVVAHGRIKQHIAAQEVKLAELGERNRLLKAEVDGLKQGNSAVEEYARLDLGLIKPGETFVYINTAPASTPVSENFTNASGE